MFNFKTNFFIFLAIIFLFCAEYASAGTATLTWDANTEPDLAGYKIYYGTSPRTGTCAMGGYTNSVSVGKVTSYTFNNLTDGSTYYFSVTAIDTSNNESCFSEQVSKLVPTLDTTIPTLSEGMPSSTLLSGTTQATMSLKTSESATCRYSATPNIAFASMANTFYSTGGTYHSQIINGLVDGDNKNYYVKCQDSAGNTSADYLIKISVAMPLDTTPPYRSYGYPNGLLPMETTQTTVSLQTDENAICRYSTVANTPYSSMTNTFSTTGGKNHSHSVSGLVSGQSYTYYFKCIDSANNANTDDYIIRFAIAAPVDNAAPERSEGLPTGTLTPGTTQATISLVTNENAVCKYSYSQNDPYASMTGEFSTTGGVNHSQLITGMTPGVTKYFYVRCMDNAGNVNMDDYIISFYLPAIDTTEPFIFNAKPYGQLAPNTTQVEMSLNTNEIATCKYSTVMNTVYSSMANTFTVTGSMQHSQILSGLVSGKTYNYFIRCQDASSNANTGDFIISFSIPSPSDTTAPLISNLVAYEINTNNATIMWATDEPATSEIEYGLSTYYGAKTTIKTALESSHTVLLTNLSAGTTYHYRARSIDAAGNIAYSVDKTFSTLPMPTADVISPSSITNLGATNVKKYMAYLFWSAPGDDGKTGYAYGYDIRFSTSPLSEATWGSAIQVTGEPTPSSPNSVDAYQVLGLQSGTKYYFAIKTRDEANNWSAISNVLAVTTLSGGKTKDTSDFYAAAVTKSAYHYASAEKIFSEQPKSFRAIPAESQVLLTWANPTDPEFARVMLIRSEYPIKPNLKADEARTNGMVIYEGTAQEYTDIGLDNTKTYYYGIYAFDAVPNYSQLRHLSIKPEAGKLSVELDQVNEAKESEVVKTSKGYTKINNAIKYKHLYGVQKSVVEEVSNNEAVYVAGQTTLVPLTAEEKAIYERLLAKNKQVLSQDKKIAIANFIHNGTDTTQRLGAGERAGVVDSFFEAFGRLPKSASDWKEVIKIANGRWPGETVLTAEQAAKATFKKIYNREAVASSTTDQNALSIMTYGLRSVNRSLKAEKAAQQTFKQIYGYGPKNAKDWDAIRAIAYSGAKR